MLWKCTFPSNDRTHYMMGTMHLSSIQAFRFVDMAEHALQNCTYYAAETDVGLLERSSNSFSLPPGISLLDLLGEKKYIKVGTILQKSFGIEWEGYKHMLPFFISSMLAVKCSSVDFPCNLDHKLWQMAVSKGIQTGGLETLEDQKRILDSIPMEFQVRELLHLSSNISSFRKRMKTLQSLYAEGDLKQLYRLTKKHTGPIRQIMLHQRNANMMEVLLPLMSSHSVFVAVGASHLGGNIGILAQLKKKGAVIQSLVKPNVLGKQLT